MKTNNSLYETLGVAKDATLDEIKKAFKKLAVELHPDKTNGDESKAERFKEVQHAYSVLSDVNKRRIYDETGESNQYSEEIKAKFRESLYEHVIFPHLLENDFMTVDRIVGVVHKKIIELKKAVSKDLDALKRLKMFYKGLKKNDNCKDEFLINMTSLKIHEINMIINNNRYQIELMDETKSMIANGYFFQYVPEETVNPHQLLMNGGRR